MNLATLTLDGQVVHFYKARRWQGCPVPACEGLVMVHTTQVRFLHHWGPQCSFGSNRKFIPGSHPWWMLPVLWHCTVSLWQSKSKIGSTSTLHRTLPTCSFNFRSIVLPRDTAWRKQRYFSRLPSHPPTHATSSIWHCRASAVMRNMFRIFLRLYSFHSLALPVCNDLPSEPQATYFTRLQFKSGLKKWLSEHAYHTISYLPYCIAYFNKLVVQMIPKM